MNRRSLLKAAAAASLACALTERNAVAQKRVRRKFTMDLCPGRIGVKAEPVKTIELAAEFGFESVEPLDSHLVGLDPRHLSELEALLKQHRLVWGAASLTMDFRKDEATFKQGLSELPSIAQALEKAGVKRIGTYIRPSSDELTYIANFRQHAERLKQVAQVLGDHGLRFGLEYVGPRSSWARRRYAFMHTLAETRELLAEIGKANVGVILDSWHWYTAEEDVATLQSLVNQDVVAVDLNDAPAGIAVQEQIDNRRELPMASGVIDVKSFLNVLVTMDYDGPVRAEPFSQRLNELDDVAAVKATANAMLSAFKLID